MKQTIYLLWFTFFSITSYSQDSYFINGKDTVRGTSINYKINSQSYLIEISYKDVSGNNVVLKGKKNLLDVVSIYRYGLIMDKIPQKVDKPKSYVKWANRVVDGKLIVNYYHNTMTTVNVGAGTTTTGITKFFIKMPDGIFYDIRKSSHMKKYIIPYLKQCDEFMAVYKGDFSKDYDSFVQTIKLYNSVCK